MIDLASPMDANPCCTGTMESRPYYPNFHYEGDKDIDVPESGKMVIRFKRTSREEADRNGKTRYRYSVDVIGIESIDGKTEGEKDNPKARDEAGSALDKIVAQLKKGK